MLGSKKVIIFFFTGGMFFGRAQDAPDLPAKTVLGLMVKCLFTGKKFLAKLIPCAHLTSAFQYQVVSRLIRHLEESGARLLAVLSDNHKINQFFHKLFPGYHPATP